MVHRKMRLKRQAKEKGTLFKCLVILALAEALTGALIGDTVN